MWCFKIEKLYFIFISVRQHIFQQLIREYFENLPKVCKIKILE